MTEENRYDRFAETMQQRFPAMLSEPYGGFAIGEGWWGIVEELCSQIQHHIDWVNGSRKRLMENNPYDHTIPEECPQVIVRQIKEKFGGLRFYYDGGDDTVDGMVRMAESWAARTCDVCGDKGKSRDGGWIRTLCDVHEAERQEKMKQYD